MLNFEFSLPTRVIFGKDAQKRLPELLKKCGAGKILLHSYAKEFTDKIPVYQEVRRLLEENEIAYTELLGVQANPTLEFIGTGIDVCRREGVDFILAVGGGSGNFPLDTQVNEKAEKIYLSLKPGTPSSAEVLEALAELANLESIKVISPEPGKLEQPVYREYKAILPEAEMVS